MEIIKEVIDQSHDPSLINPDESPNGNTIFHIYSDGEITQQKGGKAYGQRSEFSYQYSVGKKIPKEMFPLYRNDYGYAIVTYEDALKIRELIKNS